MYLYPVPVHILVRRLEQCLVAGGVAQQGPAVLCAGATEPGPGLRSAKAPGMEV